MTGTKKVKSSPNIYFRHRVVSTIVHTLKFCGEEFEIELEEAVAQNWKLKKLLLEQVEAIHYHPDDKSIVLYKRKDRVNLKRIVEGKCDLGEKHFSTESPDIIAPMITDFIEKGLFT